GLNGGATFGSLFIDESGTGYTLTSTTPGLVPVASPFPYTTLVRSSVLAFTVQPTTTLAGATITPPVQVSAQDAFGNLVPAFVGTVTVAIAARSEERRGGQEWARRVARACADSEAAERGIDARRRVCRAA